MYQRRIPGQGIKELRVKSGKALRAVTADKGDCLGWDGKTNNGEPGRDFSSLLWHSWTLAEFQGNDYKKQPGLQIWSAPDWNRQTDLDILLPSPQYSHSQSLLTWSLPTPGGAQEPPLSCPCCPGWDFLGAGSGSSRNGGVHLR